MDDLTVRRSEFDEQCRLRGQARSRYVADPSVDNAALLDALYEPWREAGRAYLLARYEAACAEAGLAVPPGWEQGDPVLENWAVPAPVHPRGG